MEAIVSKITAELESISNRMNRYEEAYNKVSSNETRPNESSKNGTALLNAVADDNATSIDQQGMELASLREQFQNLNKMVGPLLARVEATEEKMDDLEQYSRSNCLILHKCENVPKQGKYLECEEYVCDVLNKNLPLSAKLQASDIDIAHPLPTKTTSHSPVIVKFLRRTQRNEVYAKKRALKGKGMVITESLTRRRLQLVEAAREAFGWSSVWTFKGDVYSLVKGKKQVIRHINDIVQIRSMANSR